MKKQKRVVKSKEELLAEMKGNAKFIIKMKFAKEQFYPAVVDLGVSVDETKMFLSSINNGLMEKFLQRMKELTFKDLDLISGLDPKGENFDKYKALLALFDDMSVFEAKEHLESMRNDIDIWITDEMRERKMDSVKARWIDEL
jgi:bifunctional ADP-heptose synthase (sugar kinase/adenylyltransferase)